MILKLYRNTKKNVGLSNAISYLWSCKYTHTHTNAHINTHRHTHSHFKTYTNKENTGIETESDVFLMKVLC